MLKTAVVLVYDSSADSFVGGDEPEEGLMYQGEERRSTLRYHPPESLVATAAFPTKRDLRLRLTNMSIGGFCFETETDISGESYFDVSLRSIEGGETLLRLDASVRVIWHIRDEATSLHTAGAQFVDLSESGRESLEKFFGSLTPKE